MSEHFSPYTTMPAARLVSELGVNPAVGLTHAEVAVRRKRYGDNAAASRTAGWRQILLRQVRSPFIYLLGAAALLSLLFGALLDASLIVLFVAGNAALGFYQEYRSEQTVKLLMKYTQHRALVRREGKPAIVESAALVPGDIVVVADGDVIPADVRFLTVSNLEITESVLTGESAPVRKFAAALAVSAAHYHQATNIGFAGTAVVAGMGEGVVIATGSRAVLGRITAITASTVRVSSFEKSLGRLSRFIVRTVLVTLAGMVAINLLVKGRGVNVVELLVFSIALAVSVIPEALPVVTTFSLSRGALRLAKHKVVVKRLTAIEDLGSIDILCTDKTGTLTENELAVDQVYAARRQSGADDAVLEWAMLAASVEGVRKSQPNNAFDLALQNRISAAGRKRIDRVERFSQIPFDPVKRKNTVIVRELHSYVRIERGAPEAILALCGQLGEEQRKNIDQWISARGREGRRVIAVATRDLGQQPPAARSPESSGMTFAGVISFIDPIKPSTAGAVAKARALGVSVKMLTGDRPEVAAAVAKTIGLIASDSEVTTGDALDGMPLPEQRKVVSAASVFARVTPEQKYKIIQMLQERHEVGFLGEGINDAPALKVANVAIAVPDAADVAKDAADVVLLSKSLAVIVNGIQEGREVFANTLKYIKATLASNFGNFYAVAIASLLIDVLPMLPLQLLLVNLLSDFPMIAIATDTVDPQELKKPRAYDVRQIATLATMLGLVSTVFDFIFFAIFSRISPAVLQTNWFIGSILTELAFLFSIRTHRPMFAGRRPSLTLLVLAGAAAVLTLAIPASSFGQAIFHFVRPNAWSLAVIFTIVAVYLAVSERVKLLYYRHAPQ